MPAEYVLPPENLLPRIGSRAEDLSQFKAEGASLKECLLRSIPPTQPTKEGMRILDFGCGLGRLLFHFQEEAEYSEIWGCDLHAESIAWLKETLGDRFRFFANEPEPPLPVEDDFFDIVLGMSVFTHLADWRSWLEEVRRILKPEGMGYLSFQGEIPYLQEVGDPEELRRQGFVVDAPEYGWERGGVQVYQSNDWTLENWSEILPVHGLFVGGLGGFQSLAVVSNGRPVEGKVHVAQPFVQQPLGQQFHGYVEYDPWGRSWWERCGWSNEDHEDIHGWFVSESGRIKKVHGSISPHGPVSVRILARPDLAGHFPSVPWAKECGFVIPASELETVPPGVHDLRIDAEDEVGREHFVRCTLNFSGRKR